MRTANQLQAVPTAQKSARAVVPDRVTPSHSSMDPVAVAELTRTAEAVVRKALDAGVDIEFIGVEPLRDRPVLYSGDNTWVVCPAAQDPLMKQGMPIPSRQRAKLDSLVKAGLNFPHLYFAHEIPKGVSLPVGLARDNDGGIFLSTDDVTRLVVRPAAPAKTRKTAELLDNASRIIASGVAKTAAAAAVLAAAPLLLLLAFEGLDPAVFGAIIRPSDSNTASPPAAWFLLTHWDW